MQLRSIFRKVELICVWWPVFVALVPLSIQSQNLIPNPSFELTTKCPTSVPDFKHVKAWGSLSWFHYMNGCSDTSKGTGQFGVPFNLFGYQKSRTGKGHAALLIDLKAILQTKLSSPLVKDSVYFIEFYVSRAEKSYAASFVMGACLSKDSVFIDRAERGYGWEEKVWADLYELKPQITNAENRLLDDTTFWVRISGTYKALGGEEYILIGYTKDASKSREDFKIISKGYLTKCCYYIDDVTVILNSQRDDLSKKDLEVGMTLALNNVVFRKGSAALLPESSKELEKVVNLMKLHPKLKIKVQGHTDSIGNKQQNIVLSEKRAKVVREYIVSKGIKAERIQFKGYGGANPIASNSTESGRQENRRVEILIMSK